MVTTNSSRKFWQAPWSYGESFAIAFEILIIGFILELLTKGRGLPAIAYPVNIFTLVLFIALIVATNQIFRQSTFIRWVGSIPAAISAIALFTVMAMFMGFFPQDDAAVSPMARLLGLSHMKTAWPMALTQVFFLFTLGSVTMRRCYPLNRRNVAFLINHAGLWITIAGAVLGSGDLRRLNVKLVEGATEFKDMAIDQRMGLYKLPFKLQLLDFRMEEYHPKIAVINAMNYMILDEERNNLALVEKNVPTDILHYTITADSIVENAVWDNTDSLLRSIDTLGSSVAVHLTVKDKRNGNEVSQWVSPGGMLMPFLVLRINDEHAVGLTTPEARLYQSDIVIDRNGSKDTTTIEVNKPYKMGRWKLYQVSYDEKMGRHSTISVLEAIYDPWLPVIYLGIFMLIAGGIYIFWIGKDIKE